MSQPRSAPRCRHHRRRHTRELRCEHPDFELGRRARARRRWLAVHRRLVSDGSLRSTPRARRGPGRGRRRRYGCWPGNERARPQARERARPQPQARARARWSWLVLLRKVVWARARARARGPQPKPGWGTASTMHLMKMGVGIAGATFCRARDLSAMVRCASASRTSGSRATASRATARPAVVPSWAPPTSRRRRRRAGTATAPPPPHRERAREWRHERAMVRRARVRRVAREHRRASARVTARTSERRRRRRREQHAQAQHKIGLPMVWIRLVARCDQQCEARQSHRLCCPRRWNSSPARWLAT